METFTWYQVFLQVLLPAISGGIACFLHYIHLTKDVTGFSKTIKEDGKVYYELGYWKAIMTGAFAGLIGVHFLLPEGSLTFSKVLITGAFTGISGIGFLLQNAITGHKETAQVNQAKVETLESLTKALLGEVHDNPPETNQTDASKENQRMKALN
jgi:hypothetical protein